MSLALPHQNQHVRPNGLAWPNVTCSCNDRPRNWGPYNCLHACVAMLVRFLDGVSAAGINRHPANPASARERSEDLRWQPRSGWTALQERSSNAGDAMTALRGFGHGDAVRRVNQGPFRDLRWSLAEGRPAIMLINTARLPAQYRVGSFQGGHAVVGWTYDPVTDEILVSDPLRSYERRERWIPRSVIRAAASAGAGSMTYIQTVAAFPALAADGPLPEEPEEPTSPPVDEDEEPEEGPQPEPETEDVVRLLYAAQPYTVARLSPDENQDRIPVFHPASLDRVTQITTTDKAKIVGRTFADDELDPDEEGYYGVLINTRHQPGPDPKLLLVRAKHVSNLRPDPDITSAAEAGELAHKVETLKARLAKVQDEATSGLSALTDKVSELVKRLKDH